MLEFTFAGYLVQEHFVRDIPGRAGFDLATMDKSLRYAHPDFKKPIFEEIGGLTNATILRIAPPDMSKYPGFTLSGYAIETTAISQLMADSRTATGLTERYERYGYARKLVRPRDGLTLLGYELIDGRIEFLSLLHNCGMDLDEITKLGGELNKYGLFPGADAAERFKINIRQLDPDEPHFELPVIWQVWGYPE